MAFPIARKLRHLKCVRFENIPLAASLSSIEWFYTIELVPGNQLIYISENSPVTLDTATRSIESSDHLNDLNNNRSLLTIEFDQLPEFTYNNHNVKISLYACVENVNCNSDGDDERSNHSLERSSSETVSVKIKELTLCLDANLRLKKNVLKTNNSTNAFYPTFQFDDLAWYVYVPETLSQQRDETHSLESIDDAAIELAKFAYTNRKSYSFNALLKLNKLLEYHYELDQEISNLKDEIDVNYQLPEQPYKKTHPVFQIQSAIDQLELDVQKQQNDKAKQEGRNDKLNFIKISLQEKLKENVDFLLPDDSNDMIKDYKRRKQQLTELKIRKIQKLLNIFESCNVVSGLYPKTSVKKQYPTLAVLQPNDLLLESQTNDKKRLLLNSKLGYYLLLIQTIAEKILQLPLRYSVQFYGSSSLVEYNYPLYIMSTKGKQNESFKIAVHYINVDIKQVQSYIKQLYHH